MAHFLAMISLHSCCVSYCTCQHEVWQADKRLSTPCPCLLSHDYGVSLTDVLAAVPSSRGRSGRRLQHLLSRTGRGARI